MATEARPPSTTLIWKTAWESIELAVTQRTDDTLKEAHVITCPVALNSGRPLRQFDLARERC